MALLVDAANQMLTPTTSEDLKHTVPITNPWVRRRERQGAALRAAAAAAVVKPPTKPAFPNVKEDSKPTQPIQEAAPKPSTSGPTKKPAPSLKRGGNSGIMQAFSKTATKPTKVKKEAEVATPSSEDSSMQPLSDDGEDDEELPQPKPRAGSGFKTKRQREEDLRRMMEEDDEEEEVEEKEETPEEEPMEEEEPPAPEPVKEEEAEVVTASTDGRRRGKRRIMRKKQIMDDQGYLGTLPIQSIPPAFNANVLSQSRFKNLDGSLSRKMRRPHRPNPRPRAQLRLRLQSQKRVVRRARATSWLFSPRSDVDCYG